MNAAGAEVPAPDPLVPAPRADAVAAFAAQRGLDAADAWRALVRQRAQLMRLRDSDPFDYGFVPPIWSVVWSLLDWPFWPPALERRAIAAAGAKDLWGAMARMREHLGFEKRCNMVWVSGANRAGKTQLTAYMANAQMAGKPDQAIYPMAATHGTSLDSRMQQRLYDYIPPALKETGKTAQGYVAFKSQTGFSGDQYRFPNGSVCSLLYYSQDPGTAMEGLSADAILPDETIPEAWFRRIGPRIAARGGYAVLTNTPQQGYTDVVDSFMRGAMITRWTCGYLLPRDGKGPDHAAQLGLSPAELAEIEAAASQRPERAAHAPESRPEDCWAWLGEEPDWRSRRRLLQDAPTVRTPAGRVFEAVPRVARCQNPDRAIVWFVGGDNPFGRPRNLLQELHNSDRDSIRCRIYGVVNPAARSAFPKFRREIHVLRRDQIPTAGTRYMVLDPAFARNAFMLWAIASGGALYIYREFPGAWAVPEVGVPGPWAERSPAKGGMNDGARGEGAASFGWGYIRYKDLIARCEGWEEAGGRDPADGWSPEEEVRRWRDDPTKAREPVARRLIDPRGGSAASVAATGTTTPLIEYAALGMRFEPAFSGHIQAGVDAVQDALDWTPERRPRLFVSEDCPNTIYALENWRGVDGEKGATKDPVDCVRYFYTSGCTEDTQHLAASPRRESRWRRSQDLGAPRRVRVRFR